MAYEFKITRRVEFSETDMAGIMHFSNYFRIMETAEHAFCRSLGFSVVMSDHHPPIGFPRVHAECDYKRPVRFEDMIEVHLLVQEKRTKSITYAFRFRNLSATPVEEVARGVLAVVCVAVHAHGKMASVPIPAAVAHQIEVAPAELLT